MHIDLCSGISRRPATASLLPVARFPSHPVPDEEAWLPEFARSF